jgi:hypothetical protein
LVEQWRKNKCQADASPAQVELIGRAEELLSSEARSSGQGDSSPETAEEALELGIALDSDSVFRDARRRAELVFKINVIVSLLLTVLFFFGVGAAIVLGVMGKDGWAIVAGGVTIADLAGLLVFKPLSQINASVIETQRLDIVHLSARQRLQEISNIESAEERVAAATSVWNDIKTDLQGLAATDPK